MVFVYLANPSGVPLAETLDLAEQHGVIVKAYFTRGPVLRADSNLAALTPDSPLILAYRNANGILDYRTFRLGAVADRARTHMLPLKASPAWPPGRACPAVFGALAEDSPAAAAVVRAGYDNDRRDPQLGKWVVICLVEDEGGLDHDQTMLGALNDWYDDLGNTQATVHILPDAFLAGDEAPIAASTPVTALPPIPALTTPVEAVAMEARQSGIGVDFSGAQDPAATTWLAEVVPQGAGLLLVRCLNGWTHAALAAELQGPAAAKAVSLVDFPFGLAAHTCANLGLAQGAAYPLPIWQAVAACGTPDAFRNAARAGVQGPGSEVPHRRMVDNQFHTPFAPVNLRLYRQTYHGQASVLQPLHGQGGTVYPWADVGHAPSVNWVGEGCPSSSLQVLGLPHVGYKGPSAACAHTRAAILDGLVNGFGLTLADGQRHAILADAGGDALDAVVLAVVAACVDEEQRAAGRAWRAQHPTEAFIYV